ncbi:hypothetical protein AGMMS50256_22670 [Betaproteobacteria bacterium]|nr:hypothetical protein AGMMS50256_22670 [Betaproteobacteria bacterium]
MTDPVVLSLTKLATTEKIVTLEIESTELAQTRVSFRKEMLSELNRIEESRNLERIVAVEKFLVQFDLKEHANSKNMTSSLATAQKELEAIETNIGLVGNSKRYKEIDTSHVQPKVRDSHDLPLDSARIAFRSHDARLVNYDKTKSDDHEKAIIQARRQNIKTAEKLYIERQEKALGRESGEQRKEQTKRNRNKDEPDLKR